MKNKSLYPFMRTILAAAIFLILGSNRIFGFDWPMWRADAGRTASIPNEAPVPLEIAWRVQCPPQTQAWEDPLNRDLMQFDRYLEPVAANGRMFVGSSTADSMQAFSLEDGSNLWTFFADGPIRMAPALWQDLVFFTSDDGYLYCLRQADGEMQWKVRGVPRNRLLLGNSRLISTWPARGGPVISPNGTVYFTAGIWPFMGIFIHALDAKTGGKIWTNDGSGDMYILQPHNSPAFSGVAPQGNLVLVGDNLLVPGGRSVAAGFNAVNGEFEYFRLAEGQRRGGAFVCGRGGVFFNYVRDGMTDLFAVQNGAPIIRDFGYQPVLGEQGIYCSGSKVIAYSPSTLRQVEEVSEKNGEKTVKKYWTIDRLWEFPQAARNDLIQTGRRLFGADRNRIFSLALGPDGSIPVLDWETRLPDNVVRLIAASGNIIAVTDKSEIFCLKRRGAQAQPIAASPDINRLDHRRVTPPLDDAFSGLTNEIIRTSQSTDQYGVIYHPFPDRLPEALVEQTATHWIVVEPDPVRARDLRLDWTRKGLYGKRISLIQSDLKDFNTAPYFAAISVLPEIPHDAGEISRLWERMRPYGGRLFVPAAIDPRAFKAIMANSQARREASGAEGWLEIRRDGPLPGADNWTHQYGNPANTVKSDDSRVRLPLGILWFGGNSHVDVLPRHGHGPPEQVMGGRLFIEGINCLSARDVYTGKVLWKKELPHLNTFGVYYDETYKDTPLSMQYNQVHLPGANARGTNFVVCQDRIYVIHGDHCLVLEPETGKTLGSIVLPDQDQKPVWGYLGVHQDLLIAGYGAVRYSDYLKSKPEESLDADKDLDLTSSTSLAAFNRYTGEVLWTYHSSLGLRHNAIALGNGRLFCIDALPQPVREAMERRGMEIREEPGLVCLDIRSGEPIWTERDRVFGTWLGYSEEFEILLEAGRKSRDMVFDEISAGMNAYRARDGSHLWSSDAEYGGPLILHHDRIISDRYSYNLLDGTRINRVDPITQKEQPWAFHRQYGCNYAIASEHLMTFRSAAAGFFDLENDGGTGNFGGFKSGCTSNLIAADGVLNAPDYTRTCSCSYQNQTSLAMIHMPELDYWVTYTGDLGDGPIRQLGVNFGAPGHRRDREDQLWIAYPPLPYLSSGDKTAGLSEKLDITVAGGKPFTRHPFNLPEDVGHNWVLSSGMDGIESIEIPLNTEEPVQCHLKMLFCLPSLESRAFAVEVEGSSTEAGATYAVELDGAWEQKELAWSGVIRDGRLDLKFRPIRPGAMTLINGLVLETRPAPVHLVSE